jgi:hypothetical protein
VLPAAAAESAVLLLVRAADCAVVVAAVPAAVVAPLAVSQAVLDGLPPRLPPRIALPVAVQPAPGVEVGGLAAGVDGEVDCATAKPVTARVAAAITAWREVFVFILK